MAKFIKEALACGIPFVSTDVSDLHEISLRRSSCLISSPDVNSMSESIIKAINQPKDDNIEKEVENMSMCHEFQKTH